jgi:hypothetical protein
MKYLKMLGLVAVTAVAMMGFAGSASATFTSPKGTEYTGEFAASAGSSLRLKAGLDVTCTESTVKGLITTNDPDHGSGPLTALSFGGCNGTVDTLSIGSLTFSGDELFAIGSNVTVEQFGITCTYGGGSGTQIGTLTNTGSAGNETVTLDVNANLPKQAGGASCANVGVWSGSYIVTTPHENFLDLPVGSFTSPKGNEYTGAIDMSAESSLLFKAGIEVTCTEATVKGTINSNSAEHAKGPLNALSFAGCNGTVHALPGSLTIEGDKVIAIGSVFTIEQFGTDCFYGVGAGTEIGTLTNTTNTKGQETVTLDVNAQLPRLEGSSVLCSAVGLWTGSYTVTTPHPSYVDLPHPAGASFTSPTGTGYTGEIDATAESSLRLQAGIEATCTESTVKGNLTTNDLKHASGQLTALSFAGCNATVHTLDLGSLTTSGDELTAIGSKVTVQRFGVTCTYGGGAGTKVGTLTNTTLNGKDAVTLDVNANLSKQAGGAFCANTGLWSGSYVITTPVENYLDFT